MTAAVAKIVAQVEHLDRSELEELDEWDAKLKRDSRPGGRLEVVMDRVRKDIAEGRARSVSVHASC